MIGFYDYTVILTYLGMLSSFTGMCLAFRGSVPAAVVCLLFSGLCDLFDGKVARTKPNRTEEEKRFGIQIDSLSDVICFGVFPAVLGVACGADRWWQIALEGLFVLCGLIRLAYFNVTEETRQKQTTANRHEYLGVPITTSCLVIPLLMCFAGKLGTALPTVYVLVLAALGICYVAPLHVKKPGKFGTFFLIGLGIAVVVLFFALR